jgi:rhodanese-related sulfurtransferase
MLLARLALLAILVPGWQDADLIWPKDLAARLAETNKSKPVLLHVGFGIMYRSKHIPNSIYVGPGNRPEGLEALKKAVADLPKDKEIYLYCGCCPWDHCPNMRPMFAALRELGFKRVKALYVETNLKTDWFDKGYPAE